MLQKSKIKLGISVGDLHGIGLQVILKTFQDNKILQKCTPIIFAPYNICCDYTNIVEEKPITLNKINSILDLHPNKINILENKKYNHKLAIGIPSKKISPFVGVSKPANIIKVVVFPEPDGPSIVRNSPLGISTLRSLTTNTSPS